MFRNLRCGWIIVIILFFYNFAAMPQNGQIPTAELKNQAKEAFEAGSYYKAYENYTQLLNRYPKDGLFNYYAGICLVELHKNLPSAIEYLEFAATKSMVPPEVFYYLGLAYRENYQFPESVGIFKKYTSAAGKSGLKEFDPLHETAISGNAMDMTLNYNPFEIHESSLFTFSDSNYVRQIKNKGGSLTVKPDDLFSKNEKKGELTNYYFRPRNINKGDYVYFAGYGRSKKKGTDIFRIKRNIRNGWGEAEPIEEINTGYDEIMPYFDPVSNDLYFASKGHKSIGGFDVFKSHYDPQRDNWSEPISLGFPVNSPDNEYLVMPGPDLGTILLITDRQGLDSMMIVYILQMKEPKKSLATAGPDEIRRIGRFGGIESITSIVDMRNDPVSIKTVSEVKKQVNSLPEEKINPVMPNGYQVEVKKALAYQVSADSLSRLAREARIRVREMPDPDARWAWQRKIIAWEKEASDSQEKAEDLYVRLRTMEKGSEAKALPSAIRKDTVINDITLYTYRSGEQKQETIAKEPGKREKMTPSADTFDTSNEPGDKIETGENGDESASRFVILGKSPYSDKNPFPVDTGIPAGSFYKIQLGVFGSKVGYDTFGGISPITAETIPGKNLTRFYAGKFSHYDEARIALEKVRQAGFPDAFVVGWYDGQKMPVSRILELEKRDSSR